MNKAFACLLSVLFLFACNKKNESDTTPTPTPVAVQRHVEYRIACTDCEVIYYNGHGDTSVTEFHKNSSWSYSFEGKAGDHVLLVAMNTASAPQGVTACIKLNGDTLASQTTYCPISGTSLVSDTLQ